MRAQGEIGGQEPTGLGLNHGGLADGAARSGGPRSCPPLAAEIGQLNEGAWPQGGISPAASLPEAPSGGAPVSSEGPVC